MATLKRRRINNEIEKQILTAAIISTPFCKECLDFLSLDYFKIEYVYTVLSWTKEYYGEYLEAPKERISSIFSIEKEGLASEEIIIIKKFLDELSHEFELQETFNVPYIIDSAREYAEKRSLEQFYSKGKDFVEAGKYELAKDNIKNFTEIRKEISAVFDPFSKEEICSFDPLNSGNKLFQLPGALGQLAGHAERDWLIAVTAPEKRGKTWILLEIIIAALVAGLNVIWYSLEMPKEIMKDRIYRRFTGLPLEISEENIIIFPVFDCLNNQDNSCERVERVENDKMLKHIEDDLDSEAIDSLMPEELLEQNPNHKPCQGCRDCFNSSYSQAIWYVEQKDTKAISTDVIEKKLKHFAEYYGGQLRMESFPKFSKTISELDEKTSELEANEGFVADVIAIDYFDICAGEANQLSERGNIDSIWKKGARMAGERHACVITADQSSKAARQKDSIDVGDTTEDKRKDAHLDMRLTLNQTPIEKRKMIARLGCLFHRHRAFDEESEVTILQSLSLGQPMLDSNKSWKKPNYYKEKK